MRLFRVINWDDIVEPAATGNPAVCWVGGAHVVLFDGYDWPEECGGVEQILGDWDRAALLAELEAVAGDDPAQMSPVQAELYGVLSAPDLAQVKQVALADIKDRHAVFLRLLTGDYSDEERDTWAEQKSWAKSYLADQGAAQHLVGMLTDNQHQALVDAGQNPAAVMAAKILGKAKAFADHTTTANRLRNEAVEELESSTTAGQVRDALAAFEAQVNAALDGQAAN